MAIFLLACVGLWFYVRGASEIKIRIKFVGFTNNAAAFVVSNEGRCRVFAAQCDYEACGFAGLRYSGERVGGMMLSPGQSDIILVPTQPVSDQPWRIVVDFSPDDWRHDLAMKPPWVQYMVRDLVRGSEDRFREKRVSFYGDWLGSSGVVELTNRVEVPRVYTSPPQAGQVTTDNFKKIELKH
ncbi:hypothetical protein [Pedosphaera parvula]|uniref:Uncharacterized protein n=1 Tax=Pedosphaera parvula (strain Ellin514) TaxID=320771 RepID=B9XLZ3_PEDPL|nr:hypothetical protein [Pedosphaera parvula]EEF59121.1 hypothetical protein Cflav_PD1613 [Pedosphaera parvula Ellin514]